MNRKKDYFCTTIKFIENTTQTHWMKHYLFVVSETPASSSNSSNFATLSSLSFLAFNSLQFCLSQFSNSRVLILWREGFL